MTHDTQRRLRADPDYVELSTIPRAPLVFDLRYASTNNFMGENVYGEFNAAFLHRRAAQKLELACAALRRLRAGLRFVVFDALRPRSIQRVLHAFVAGTENEMYVGNPDRGSAHNFGCAIDLSLADERGALLDMGTGFDEFTLRSQPRHEAELYRQGQLTRQALDNRRLLRACMEEGGFLQLPHEWWHYDAFPIDVVRRDFRIIE